MLTERTDRAWFSRLLRHPARKQEWVYSFNPQPTRCPDATACMGKSKTIHLERSNTLELNGVHSAIQKSESVSRQLAINKTNIPNNTMNIMTMLYSLYSSSKQFKIMTYSWEIHHKWQYKKWHNSQDYTPCFGHIFSSYSINSNLKLKQ